MSNWRRVGFAPLLLLLAGCGLSGGGHDRYPTVSVDPTDDLQALLDTLTGPVVVELEAGDYHLEAVDFTDPSCGNCEDASEQVPATRGLRIRGADVHLRGASARETVIHTHAGYGILFDGCRSCSLVGVTVTDGVRDPDGRATDAGIVVRDSDVTVADCTIRDNLGDSAVVHSVVVGVAGVAVREDGDVTVERCRIERNSWDGIAAYRGARLKAMDNVVDGVDKASGASMGGGRGVGIGLTWDARGFIEGNLVTRYWKGIGVFVDAQAEITGNVVEDVLTWGIAYWGPDGGAPIAWIHDNVVFETGACGVSVDRTTPYDRPSGPRQAGPRQAGPEQAAPRQAGDPPDSGGLDGLDRGGPGAIRDNVFVRTGQDERYDSGEPYCFQRPIARHNVPDGFIIEGNLVHDVRQPGELPFEPEVGAEDLRTQGRALLRFVSARPVLAASRFAGAYAAAARVGEAPGVPPGGSGGGGGGRP